jgi:hypothetical protein
VTYIYQIDRIITFLGVYLGNLETGEYDGIIMSGSTIDYTEYIYVGKECMI